MFCTKNVFKDDDIKFIFEVNSKYLFETVKYYKDLIALIAFLYESKIITFALVHRISKILIKTIK